MKALKKNYSSYSINELDQLFKKQKEEIRQTERQKKEMNQNAHKTFKDIHLFKPTSEDLELSKQHHMKLQKLDEIIDDCRQELKQIAMELSKKKKENHNHTQNPQT